MIATTIVYTVERKTAFGQQARHVKIAIDRQPMAGACDTTKQRVEIDGWYIDAPGAIASQAGPEAAQNASGCADQIQSTSNGDPTALGFPIAYTFRMTGDDGKPVTAKMEVTEFELTTHDPALFEIPAGLNAAMNVRELSRALSDASEAKLAEFNAAGKRGLLLEYVDEDLDGVIAGSGLDLIGYAADPDGMLDELR